MFEDYKAKIEDYLEKVKLLEGYLQLSTLTNEKSQLERQLHTDNIWDTPEKATALSKDLKRIEDKINTFNNLAESIRYIADLLELNDESMNSEIEKYIADIEKNYRELELQTLLNEKFDNNNVIFTINAGAGGTDAQDWAEMLLRMYKRWFENKNFKFELIDISAGDEAGIKSATFTVEGDFAYGMLKSEHGIHRLVRLSPFNSNNKRQTSFASVDIIPQIENSSAVTIRPDEIRVDTYRASGAGGQHVNKTDSAVRITHIETGITAQCQSSRSQTQNKEKAMQVIISKLEQYFQKINDEEKKDIATTNKEISWGNQIRSYVFHPYTMVKDLRTNYETSNIGAVMDGDLDSFIEAYLHFRKD